jgi:hypothetical protein
VTEVGPFTLLAPLTLLLTGGVPPAGVVPFADVVPVVEVVLVVPAEDSGGGGTVTLDPVELDVLGMFALHGPATVLTTGAVVPVVAGIPSGLPTGWPGSVVLL